MNDPSLYSRPVAILSSFLIALSLNLPFSIQAKAEVGTAAKTASTTFEAEIQARKSKIAAIDFEIRNLSEKPSRAKLKRI